MFFFMYQIKERFNATKVRKKNDICKYLEEKIGKICEIEEKVVILCGE